MSDRWQMNRIGFCNFWLYDEEEFEFENGKLLLRGQNASGKSITTQSFIPFILDGDRTPSRLDPFGSQDRRMEYYFLGEEGKEESTGYLYLEFSKKGTNEYRTLGIGQRARKGKPMDFWGFVLLDGRRIGYDIWLYREVGNTKIPLEKTDLKKILGEETPFTDQPKEYKEFVNKYLFGFAKAEQYEQFIKLLIKIRAPKLSKDFKPTKVYDILNDSLQTLSDEDLRPMVDAMEKMDSIQENLEQLNKARADVRNIRNEYNRYNQYMLGKKAIAYLEAKSMSARAQEEMDRQGLNKGSLLTEQEEKQSRADWCEEREKLIKTELESLFDPDLEELETKQDSAQSDLEDVEKQHGEAKGRIEKSRGKIREVEVELRRKNGELEVQNDCLRKQRENLEEIQEELQWSGHSIVVKSIESQDVERLKGIVAEIKQYEKGITEAKRIIEEYDRLKKQRDEAAEEADRSKRKRDEKQLSTKLANEELDLQRDCAITDLYAWSNGNRECVLSEDELSILEDIIQDYLCSSDSTKYSRVLLEGYSSRRQELEKQKQQKALQRQEKEKELSQLKEGYELLEKQEDLEPDRKEAAKLSRTILKEVGIVAVPFYRAVEFAPELSEQECAVLEAQLEDIGLLDALIVGQRDLERVSMEFPEFADRIIAVEERGDSDFCKLAVNEEMDPSIKEAVDLLLSNLYEGERNLQASVWLSNAGEFRHGVLTGRSAAKERAEYVGVLARQQKKEKCLRQLREQIDQAQKDLEGLTDEEKSALERLDLLREEYEHAPTLEKLDEALKALKDAEWELEQAKKVYADWEKKLEFCEREEKAAYQKLLAVCKEYPYGRTAEEYENARVAAEDYGRELSDTRDVLSKIIQINQTLRYLQDNIDREEEAIDSDDLTVKRTETQIAKLKMQIERCREYMERPDVKKKAETREKLRTEQDQIESERKKLGERLAVIADRLQRISEEEDSLRTDMLNKVQRENILRGYFEEELNLKLVLERGSRSLEDCATEARKNIRTGDEVRDVGALTAALHQVFTTHSGNLIPYTPMIEECLDDAEPGIDALRRRQRFVFNWNGKRIGLEEFFDALKAAIENLELLIQQKDRELFEDILSRTISQQLTDRIAESRRWVQDMSALMKIDTSMGMYFALEWKPRTAENDQELDTRELEKILLRDYELLSHDDIEKVAAHFRSKIRTEKLRAEETGDTVNYLDLVHDALDYRKWFEFQMFFYRNNEGRKNLTNAAFNRFSGGEKAMAMYVPLFAAVNAQYKKAGNKDHPRILALDEAFAGVDDKNISSMFKLVEDMDFDYIMNSQALWGCFETVPALRISELHRPQNSDIVTVIHYTWNGHERILNEQ